MDFNLNILETLVYPIVGDIYEVHRELGSGLNEYVYQEGLAMQLEDDGIEYDREKEFIPTYHNRLMNATYRPDFLCLDSIIVECKAVEKLTSEHRAQLFNYMRLTKKQAGILVNFASRSAIVERYFYNPQNNEILNFDGIKLTHFADRSIKISNNDFTAEKIDNN